jgi:hypothetical protein
MSYPNLKKYVEFERAIKKVGEYRLRLYILSKGHRIDKFDRNMKMIRYTLQHGPVAASKVFHVSETCPSSILYKYGKYAEELAEIIEKEE